MQFGFTRVAAATPYVKIADCAYNRVQIRDAMVEAAGCGCELLVLPELCVTGYTCGDLFRQRTLIAETEAALVKLAEDSKAFNLAVAVGAPIFAGGRLFNCAVIICRGEILGVVPKTWLPNYAEFSEKRAFTPPYEHDPGDTVRIGRFTVPFGTRLLFQNADFTDFTFAVEICEDIWSPIPPSSLHALAGATIAINLSASNETAGKADYRRAMVAQQSGRLYCAYIYTSAGDGESTSDLVFSGHNLITENGRVLAESELFENGMIRADIDISQLMGERTKSSTFVNGGGNAFINAGAYRVIPFSLAAGQHTLERKIDRAPFVPAEESARKKRCAEVLAMQTAGLVQRLRHTGIKHLTLALSGGLDSSLALMIAVRAFDKLGLDRKGIHALSMPCFGTSARTKNNASALADMLGVSYKEIDIRASVLQHFEDIGHSPDDYSLVYENAQARERTQVAMDYAAKVDGMMLGTGDLSELALGFTTYNGDHMSMYNVNASVPKTLIPHLLLSAAEAESPATRAVAADIAATPISPELLPPESGVQAVPGAASAQETEAIIGPYELHDFFIYHTLRYGASPERALFLAEQAFAGDYDRETLTGWLAVFYKRFFASQFKRSCAPDGPKVGSVCLSPRGDWRMPSDASARAWLDVLQNRA